MQLKYNSVKTTLDINVISGYSKTRSRLLKNLNNKPDKAKLKSLNGYDAIGEKLGENNTLTVKQPVVNEKTKTKASIGLN